MQLDCRLSPGGTARAPALRPIGAAIIPTPARLQVQLVRRRGDGEVLAHGAAVFQGQPHVFLLVLEWECGGELARHHAGALQKKGLQARGVGGRGLQAPHRRALFLSVTDLHARQQGAGGRAPRLPRRRTLSATMGEAMADWFNTASSCWGSRLLRSHNAMPAATVREWGQRTCMRAMHSGHVPGRPANTWGRPLAVPCGAVRHVPSASAAI